MSERKYRDSNGIEMSLGRLVVAEPEWAANQIRRAIGNEARITELEAEIVELRSQIEKWKTERWREAGCPIGDGR